MVPHNTVQHSAAQHNASHHLTSHRSTHALTPTCTHAHNTHTYTHAHTCIQTAPPTCRIFIITSRFLWPARDTATAMAALPALREGGGKQTQSVCGWGDDGKEHIDGAADSKRVARVQDSRAAPTGCPQASTHTTAACTPPEAARTHPRAGAGVLALSPAGSATQSSVAGFHSLWSTLFSSMRRPHCDSRAGSNKQQQQQQLKTATKNAQCTRNHERQ
jgi:hypothetical protein